MWKPKERRSVFGTEQYEVYWRDLLQKHAQSRNSLAGASGKSREVLVQRGNAAAADHVTRIHAHHMHYHVDVRELGTAAVRAHMDALTFTPETSGSKRRASQAWAGPAKSYKAYTLRKGVLSVPSFYGYLHWGAATTVHTTEGHAFTMHHPAAIELRSSKWYPQVAARDAVLAFWDKYAKAGVAHVTLTMPCGSGKTYTACGVIGATRRRTAILVHQERLLMQMQDSVQAMFPTLKVGVVHTSKKCEVGDEYDVVIIMIPTLVAFSRRMSIAEVREKIRAHTFGVIVGDEAHHMAAGSFMKVVSVFNARYALWLTATPERDDGLVHQLEYVTGPIVYKAPARPGALAVALVKYKVDRPVLRTGCDIDFSAMQTASATDSARNRWLAGLVCQMLDNGRTVLFNTARALLQVGPIVKLVYESGKGKRHWLHKDEDGVYGPLISAVVSGGSGEEGRESRAAFKALNALPGVLAVMSGPKSKATMVAKRRLRYSRVIVAFITQFCDGFDAPWIDAAIFAGSFGSEVATIQGANRISRVLPGKATPWLVDVADALPSNGTGGERVFQNIQSKRAKIFKAQNFMVTKVTVDGDAAGGVCDRDFWLRIKETIPEVKVNGGEDTNGSVEEPEGAEEPTDDLLTPESGKNDSGFVDENDIF